MRLRGTKTSVISTNGGLGDQLWDLGGARPSLDLNFAHSKDLTDATTGQNLVTFTRASSGTYVGSDGLIKRATTNLLTYSQDFTNSIWPTSSTATITTNTGVDDPQGTNTAATIENVSGPNLHRLISGTAGVPYTYSVWLRRRSGSGLIYLTVGDAINQVVTVGDTWTRVSATNTPTSTVVRAYVVIGSTGDSVDIWGAQLEQSSTVGEYIPTTSAINSAPRFDHDPTTGESLGLLVEEQRTNLLVRSEEFDNASWVNSGSLVTANTAIAPNGTLTADTLKSDALILYQTFSNAITTYTVSAFVKSAGASSCSLLLIGGAAGLNGGVAFSFSTNTESFTGTVNSVSSQFFGNGWYRIAATLTATGAATPQVRLAASGGDVYLWGAQLEQGSFPTSYIPTTTSAVTRAADVASITGTAFSSWYRQDEGTVFADGSVANSAAISLFSLDDNTTNNRVQLRNSNLSADIRVVAAGVSQATLLTSNTTTVNTRARHAAAYKLNDLAVVLNSGTVATQSTALLPVATQATLTTAPGSATTNGTIRRLAFWPQRLPNETLQTITAN